MFWIRITIACLVFANSAWSFYRGRDEKIPRVTYQFSNEPIDVVIPCVAKDLETLKYSIEGIRKNGKNLRRIIIVSKEKITDDAEWFDETEFPFTKEEMALEIFGGDEVKAKEYLATPGMRIGWLYQQMLKYYATFVIPDISSNVLVLDSDVIFLNPVEFMQSTNGPYFAVGREYMTQYFTHAERLLPGLRRVQPQYSGIAHHMLLQRPILEDLFALIYKEHKTEAWRAFCRCIDHKELFGSPFSEYEVYFNFVQLRTDQSAIRQIRWKDVFNLRMMEHDRRTGFVYIACHEWWRTLHMEPLWGK